MRDRISALKFLLQEIDQASCRSAFQTENSPGKLISNGCIDKEKVSSKLPDFIECERYFEIQKKELTKCSLAVLPMACQRA